MYEYESKKTEDDADGSDDNNANEVQVRRHSSRQSLKVFSCLSQTRYNKAARARFR